MRSALHRGVLAVVLGLAFFVIGGQFESWLGGLFEGAAVALMLLGVVTISRARRSQMWLPSRDGASGERPR